MDNWAWGMASLIKLVLSTVVMSTHNMKCREFHHNVRWGMKQLLHYHFGAIMRCDSVCCSDDFSLL